MTPSDQDRIEQAISVFRAELLSADQARALGAQRSEEVRKLIPLLEIKEVRTESRRFAQPELTEEQPPASSQSGSTAFADVLLGYTIYSGSTDDSADPYTSPDDAYNAAVAAAEQDSTADHVSFFDPDTGNTDLAVTVADSQLTYIHPDTGDPSYSATAQRSTRHFNIATSTGYLKVYYQLITSRKTITAAGPTVTNATAEKTYTYTAGPVGTRGDTSTYYDTLEITDDVTFASTRPDDPPTAGTDSFTTTTETIVSVAGVRWSAVAGYEPPADGSANGFPPS